MTIHGYTEAVRVQNESKKDQDNQPLPLPIDIRSEVSLPVSVREFYETEQRERPPGRWRWLKGSLEVIGIAAAIAVAVFTGFSLKEVAKQAHSAQAQVEIMQNQLVLQERPWIKITHSIITPLTFNIGGRASGVPTAMMTVGDVIENVGQTVAINLLSWEDVIPVDLDHSLRTARTRQKEYCDANRHPDPRGVSGYTVFPHDRSVGQSIVGPQMPKVAEATIRSESGLNGKVAFVLVGCVFYRSSFELPSAPTHQTRFIYWLGVPQNEGGFQPYVIPSGIATELRLIAMPDGFTAD